VEVGDQPTSVWKRYVTPSTGNYKGSEMPLCGNRLLFLFLTFEGELHITEPSASGGRYRKYPILTFTTDYHNYNFIHILGAESFLDV
jgi:hypothetical protein